MADINYVCSKCGASGVKLWREYNMLHVILKCYDCASDSAPLTESNQGCMLNEQGIETDQIAPNYIPAILDTEKTAYWGYNTVSYQARTDRETWLKMPYRSES